MLVTHSWGVETKIHANLQYCALMKCATEQLQLWDWDEHEKANSPTTINCSCNDQIATQK